MKRIILLLALLVAAPVHAEQPMLASHITAMERLALGISFPIQIELFSVTATTVYPTSQGLRVWESSGTASAPSVVTEGLPLQNGSAICYFAVSVEATGGNMTAGGKLLAYVWNPESVLANKWSPWPGGDCTVTAVPAYNCTPVATPVQTSGSRVVWVASGLGKENLIYMNLQPCR